MDKTNEVVKRIKDQLDEMNMNVDEEISKRAKNGKKHKICGVSIWRVLGYLVVYSFFGYLVEVLYGLITKGVIESRQSFLYGPFCTIYGVGAICMILPLKKIKTNNKIIIFFTTGIIGCIVEYLVSLFGDYCLHVKWWDYSNYFLNINGRVCLYFGLFWGILGLLLYTKIHPNVDFLINKISDNSSTKKQYILVLLTNIFLLIDCVMTIVAVDFYQTRVIYENNIDVPLKQHYTQHYFDVYGNEKVKNRIETTWSNEFMIKTFPNLKIQNTKGEIIYLNSYYPNIQNYYIKIFDNEHFNINTVE